MKCSRAHSGVEPLMLVRGGWTACVAQAPTPSRAPLPACATSRRPRNKLISPQAPPAWWPGSPLLAALGQPTAAPSPGGIHDQIRIGTGMTLLTTPPQASGPASKWHVLGCVKQISNAHAAVYIASACMLAVLYHGGSWRIDQRCCAEPRPLSL